MAKFYDSSVYPTAGTLFGDEVFIIYQGGESRTVDFDAVLSNLIHPLIDGLVLEDMVDVVITNPSNDDVLIYSDGDWINTQSGLASIDEALDVTITSAEIGQMLIWKGSLWENDYDPELRDYTETEYNVSTGSGTYDIDLVNGNIQRFTVAGVLGLGLPSMSPTNQNWNLVVKVIYNGANVPTFTSSDATLKWHGGVAPSDLGISGSMNIYVFTSDSSSSEIYGNLVWSEY